MKFLLLFLALGLSIGHVTPIRGQAPVLDPNCYFPQDDDPSQIDSIYGSRHQQGMGWGIQNLGTLWSDDPLAYVRIDNLVAGKNSSEAIATGVDFNLRSLKKRPFTNFKIPGFVRFAHFRSKQWLDMYTVIDDNATIYWQADDGTYDSARSSILRLPRPWAHDTTYSSLPYTDPYIATFSGNETATIIQAVHLVYYEGRKDSVFFLRYHFEGEANHARIVHPKEARYFDTIRYFKGQYPYVFQQDAWRNNTEIDLLCHDPFGNATYYRNDKPFSLTEFLRAIHEDTIMTRWENPRISSRNQFDPQVHVVRSMPCLPRASWDKSQDLIFATKLDSLDSDDLHLIIFKGGPEMGKSRFYVDSAAMLIRSPGSHSDFPFTGMSYDVSNAGDMTGTGNNVLMWEGSGSLRNYFFFYVTGKALDSLADIFFAMEPYAYSQLDTLTANADKFQDVIMSHPVFYTWEDHDRGKHDVGTVRVVYGSSKIPVRLNPKFSVPGNTTEASTALAWPNPFIDRITLSAKFNIAEDIQVEIFDVLGRRVFADRYHAGYSQSLTINLLSSLPAGTYIVRATQQSFSVKAVIMKK